MAGRRGRKRLKSLAQTLKDDGRVSANSDGPHTNVDLPTEILEQIFSQLSLRDNIRTSAVCKSWLAVATSLREPNKAPWLMLFPKSGAVYEFYNPVNRKRYFLEFPELNGTRICHSKDGWLLLFRHSDCCVFFFHPYTRQLVNLPRRQLAHQVVAFSAAPTSSSCIVFTVTKSNQTTMIVSTCHPGATEWVIRIYLNQSSFIPFINSIWNKIAFSRGLFYCLSVSGSLGAYDHDKAIWGTSTVPVPECMKNFPFSHWKRSNFMAEHNGDIYAIYACLNSSPFIYKLGESKREWLEINCLGGVTLFANSLSSIARSDFHGTMRNRVYFPKVLFYGKRCVTYSPDTRRYCPRNRNYDWGEEDSGQSIWIDAPEDPSEFLQRGVLMIESYHVENIIHHQHQHQQMIEYSSFLEDFHSARKALVPPSIELQWRLRSCPLHRCLAIEPP